VLFLQLSEQYTALLVFEGKNFPQRKQARIMVRAIKVSFASSWIVCDGTEFQAKEGDRFEAVSSMSLRRAMSNRRIVSILACLN
jgi:hypothetical protein